MFDILSERDLNDKYLRLEQDLYFNQHAVIKLDKDLSNENPIEIGVRQGDVLSPDFFLIYSEMITRSIDEENGVRVKTSTWIAFDMLMTLCSWLQQKTT